MDSTCGSRIRVPPNKEIILDYLDVFNVISWFFKVAEEGGHISKGEGEWRRYLKCEKSLTCLLTLKMEEGGHDQGMQVTSRT